MKLVINPKKVLLVLVFAAVTLLAVDLSLQALKFSGTNFDHLTPRFDFDQEISVPTWFAQSLLLGAAGLLWLIAGLKRGVKRALRAHWSGLALIFLLLSIDEGSMLHEAAIDPIRALLNIQGGVLYFAWVVPAVVFLGLFGLAYLRFWLSLQSDLRNTMLLAGGLYVAGAIGMEMVGGWYASTTGDGFGYQVIIAIEEFLELMGVITLIYALLKEVKKLSGGKLLF